MSAAVTLQYRNLAAKAIPQNADMKTRMGVVRAGWGEPCSALRNASVASTNRGEAGGRIPSFPQQVSCPSQRSAERTGEDKQES